MDWRNWVRDSLIAAAPIGEVPAAGIFSGGTFTGSPEDKPFIEITMGVDVPFGPGRSGNVTIWVHDDSQTYMRIDAAIAAIKEVLDGKRASGDGIVSEWTGDSNDLADDGYKTITRNTTYRLIGRRAT